MTRPDTSGYQLGTRHLASAPQHEHGWFPERPAESDPAEPGTCMWIDPAKGVPGNWDDMRPGWLS